MADEAKGNKAKDFLAKHGEKVGLGVAAAALLAYLTLGIVMAKDDPSTHNLHKEVDRLDAERNKRHAEYTAGEVKVDSGPILAPWNTVTSAKPGGDAIAQLLPTIETNEIAKPVEKVRVAMVPAISFGSAAVDFDGVTITWSAQQFTKQEMTKGKNDNDYFKIDHFLVERETNGSGKWEKLGELDGGTTTYKDLKIDPKTKYAYRITSFPEADKDAKRIERNMTAKGMVIGTPSPVATQGIWRVSFASPSKPAGAAKGMTYTTIEKYEKGRGPVLIKHMQYAGDKIGTWEEQPGNGDFVSTHRVFKDGKAFTVDFNTGYTIVSIEPTKVAFEVKRCQKIFDSGGVWTDCKIITDKRNVDTYEIVYQDDEGEKKILSPNPRDQRANQDDLCEKHGGTKKMEVKRPDAPDVKAPDQPKEDPKVVKARQREEEASKLYDAALKHEAAKNKAQAVQELRNLLSMYGDTEFVAKQHKTEIEERIARNSSNK